MAAQTDLSSIDYRALTSPVDPREVAEFEAETRAGGLRWLPRRGDGGIPAVLVLLTIVFVGVPVAALLVFLLFGAVFLFWGPLLAFAPLCLSVIGLAGYFLLPSYQAPRRGFGWEQHYRLSRFAWENGLTYTPESFSPNYKGVLFDNLPAIVYNHLTPKTGRFFDIGNIRYGQPGSGDHAMTDMGHRGFLAVHLGGDLPHIILDAKANDGVMGGIGVHLKDQPTVSLEGNFNEHFTLYCPTGYERDALYLLTPDLMVDLLDESLTFDVELTGEWMFVYSMKPLDSVDAATYHRLFRIIETVGRRAVRRSAWYRDDQYSSPAAAAAKPRGRRMPVQIPQRFAILSVAVVASLAWIPAGFALSVIPFLL